MTMTTAKGHTSRTPVLPALTMSRAVVPAIESTRWHG